MTVPTDRVSAISIDRVQQRFPKVDEEVTRLVVWSEEVVNVALAEHTEMLKQQAVTLEQHSAYHVETRNTLDRHTAFLKEAERDMAFLRMTMDTNASKMETRFSRAEDKISILQADVSGLKADVSGLKADVSDVKGTLVEILNRLPAAA